MPARLSGLGASHGLALGRVRLRMPLRLDMVREKIPAHQVDAEVARLHLAIDTAHGEMNALRQRLIGAMPTEVGEFLDLHTLLLDDPELLNALDTLIRTQRYSAVSALSIQRQRLADVFDRMEDDYLRSRLDDLDHVIGRLRQLLAPQAGSNASRAGEILVCETISPAEMVQLQANGMVGVVTTGGNTLSHSAILARSLHLPLVVSAHGALQRLHDGQMLIIDGTDGSLTPDPDPSQLQNYRQRLRDLSRERRELQRLRNKPSRTVDGVDIRLQLNAESADDLAQVNRLGASGVGLYRTEFLFLHSPAPPSEDVQFEHYRDAVLALAGRPVTFRIIDLGGDKADAAGLAPVGEDNPALGLRGIRLALSRPDILDIQLRAILRASGYGPVRILVPMVSQRAELLAVRQRLRRLSRQLKAEGHAVSGQIALGAMIEVPAAALALASFADLVDFVSVGTNDLTQYLLATDRNNDSVSQWYVPLHPAMVSLLDLLVRQCEQLGMPLSVCGEIAGDARLLPMLLSVGIREFSLHPSHLLTLRRAIRNTDCTVLDLARPALLRCRDKRAMTGWLDRIAPSLPA